MSHRRRLAREARRRAATRVGAKRDWSRSDRGTAIATAVSKKPFITRATGQAQGLDFNLAADRLRVHTDVDLNLRLVPTTGEVGGIDGALRFAASDVHAGQSPNFVATAYTNSVLGMALEP